MNIVVSYVYSRGLCLFCHDLGTGGPESTVAILKLLTYVFLLYVFCSIMAGMMLLFGIIFKELSVALVFSVSYLYLSWFVEVPASLQGVQMALSPVILYMNAIMGSSYLLESFSPVSYTEWLSSSLPFIVLLICEMVAIFLADCILFNNEET